jgi:hypothetical protein
VPKADSDPAVVALARRYQLNPDGQTKAQILRAVAGVLKASPRYQAEAARRARERLLAGVESEPVDVFARHYDRRPCGVCGKAVCWNWIDRHVRLRHDSDGLAVST